MNSYLPQSLAWDHIRESRQHAAAARKASAVRSTRRRSGTTPGGSATGWREGPDHEPAAARRGHGRPVG